jgi:16S rRNA (guanine966-N2)-methyltransferase
MRIIGGTHRSRIFLAPRDDPRNPTRPITDRVKQALFDRLVAMEAFGDAGVDVFAGTGSLGLEALSRGVEHVTFIERNRTVRALLDQNLADLGFAERAAVLGVDALSGAWIGMLPRRPLSVIFLDPPYRMMSDPVDQPRIADLIRRLADATEPLGVLVLRTDDRAQPPLVEGWAGPESHGYGSMQLHLYQRPEAQTNDQ